jgi:hypothetical protein
MKTKILLGLIFLSINQSQAQGVVDDFNGSSINPSLWTVYNTPTGNSSVTEGGGNAAFVNGAGLMTISSFTAVSVSGSFQFTGDNDDRFSIFLRFDGTSFDSHWQEPSDGIQIQFAPSSNPSPSNPSLQINDRLNDVNTSLSSLNPEIDMGTYYNFMITDSGSLINVFLTDTSTPILSATTTDNYGNIIGIFNRSQIDNPGPEHETELDSINIQPAPEPSTFSLAAIGIVLMILVHRKTKNEIAK